MKQIIFTTVLLFQLVLCGCKTSNTIAVRRFLNDIKNENYDNAKSFLSKRVNNPEDGQIALNLKRTHDFLIKYSIPAEKNWQIKNEPFVELKITKYIIPIFKGYDESNNISEVTAEIDFEKQLGDSIFLYNILVKHGRP